jgi:hypothetical protein
MQPGMFGGQPSLAGGSPMLDEDSMESFSDLGESSPSSSAPRAGGSAPPAAPTSQELNALSRVRKRRASSPTERSERDVGAGAPAIGIAAYLTQLAVFARGLLAEAKGRVDAPAIRLLRQRIVQWIEDVRSVGGNEDLASAVEAQVERLGTALAAPETLASEATAIAAELAALAAGAPPPPAKKKSRLAFWK